MKKITLLLLLAMTLMSSQCSENETTPCSCERVVYKYGVWAFEPNGITPIWSYKEQSRTPDQTATCEDAGGYIYLGGAYYYKIECE